MSSNMLAENMLAAFKGLFCILPYLFSQLTLMLLFLRSKVSQYSQTMWYHQHRQQAGGPSLLRLQRLNNSLHKAKSKTGPERLQAYSLQAYSSSCRAIARRCALRNDCCAM